LLNAPVGVQRVIGRLRRPSSEDPTPAATLQIRSLVMARQIEMRLRDVAGIAHLIPARTGRRASPAARPLRRSLLERIGHDRVIAVSVAAIVLVASVASVSASGPASGPTSGAGPVGGPESDGAAPRVAIGGGPGSDRTGSVEAAYPSNPAIVAELAAADSLVQDETAIEGPYLEDGTLLKPVAVDTTVADGKDLLRTYRVKSGDSLTGIARKFDVSMMTIWWANSLKSKDDLHVGQVLTIPPVTGLVVTVAATDTLASIADRFGVETADILTENGIDDPNLVVGQVLVVPGAAGKGIATPKPKPVVNRITIKARTSTRPRSSSGGGTVRQPRTYHGGSMLWPVVGGGNYVSQYFHYGHYGLDIAADYGSKVRAAAGGTVTFAGWKNNGGGYQVWIAHGSGLYTTYNHMSGVSVGRGQSVDKGQQVGRIGQSGNATGPHLHFEVWKGPIWDGGDRVNPLGYL
jgi:murein DD-endopeptidase MepM/ murein hydrolase activator NlpD